MASTGKSGGSRTGERARNQRVPHRPRRLDDEGGGEAPSPKPPGSGRGGVSGLILGAVLGAAAIAGVTWMKSWDSDDATPPVPTAASTNPFADLPVPPPMPDDSKQPVAPEPDLPKAPPKPAPYDGPWLGALAQATPIYPTARFSRNRLGYIRRGGKVPANAKPIKTRSCRQGFFPLVGGGYVCGKYATLNVNDLRIKHGVKKPNLEKLLPYRYAFNRAHGTPLYAKVPTREQMLKHEPYLAEKKKSATKRASDRAKAKAEAEKADQPRIDAGETPKKASKVAKPKKPGTAAASASPTASALVSAAVKAKPPAPSASSSASAKPKKMAGPAGSSSAQPAVAKATAKSAKAKDADAKDADAKDADAKPDKTKDVDAKPADAKGDAVDTEGAGGASPAKPWWQRDKGEKVEVRLEDLNQRDGVLYKRMVRGFFIAVNRTFSSNGRIWYETTDGLIAPADRMIIPKTPTLKGLEFANGVRQAGFIRAHKGYRYAFEEERKKPKRLDRLKRFSAFGLSGKTRLYKKARYRETTDGWWMKGVQGTYTSPGPRPSEVGPDEKWIDVNVTRKTLVAFIGDKPVYATLIAPGKRSKVRKRDHRTKIGKWRIREKHVTTTMDGDGTGGDLPYSIQDVPFVQYYDGSYALHGAFWHHNFGREQSHGCVNLSPNDAKYLFNWTEPQLPRGWHGVWSSEKRKGTLVVVHK